MTEIQYSAIKALATSPEAYKAFKLSVRNRKQFDQYMNRVWPFRTEKIKSNMMPTPDKLKLRELSVMESKIKYFSRSDIKDISLMISIDTSNAIIDCHKKLSKSIEDEKNTWLEKNQRLSKALSYKKTIDIEVTLMHNKKHEDIGPISLSFYVRLSILDGKVDVMPIDLMHKIALVLDRLNRLMRKKYSKQAIDKDITKNSLIRIDIAHQNMYELNANLAMKAKEQIAGRAIKSIKKIGSQVKQKANTYKREIVRTSQNIGIEIEYDGGFLDFKKEAIALGAIDFECGIDGAEGERRDESLSRLREVRMRINGLYSLNALSKLLDKMISSGCKHSENSSIHYHVNMSKSKLDDGLNLLQLEMISNSFRVSRVEMTNNSLKVSSGKTSRITKKAIEAIMFIYEFPQSYHIEKDFSLFDSSIRKETRFYTVEWRIGSKTLSYTKIILQILVAIHITNACRYANKEINSNYLHMLGEIAKELYRLETQIE